MKEAVDSCKACVALEAVEGECTVLKLGAEQVVGPAMIHKWKDALFDGAGDVFELSKNRDPEIGNEAVLSLQDDIDALAVANELKAREAIFFSKSSRFAPASEKRNDPG